MPTTSGATTTTSKTMTAMPRGADDGEDRGGGDEGARESDEGERWRAREGGRERVAERDRGTARGGGGDDANQGSRRAGEGRAATKRGRVKTGVYPVAPTASKTYQNADGMRYNDGRYTKFQEDVKSIVPEERIYTDPVKTSRTGRMPPFTAFVAKSW